MPPGATFLARRSAIALVLGPNGLRFSWPEINRVLPPPPRVELAVLPDGLLDDSTIGGIEMALPLLSFPTAVAGASTGRKNGCGMDCTINGR